MGWSTRQVATYYAYTEQTIRRWTEEFASYFSPTARPGKDKNREFLLPDLEIIALIAAMKESKATYQDIHATLASGQRGKAPDLTEKDLAVLAANTGEKRANLEIEMLQRSIVDLTQRLQIAEQKAAETVAVEKENVRLTTQLEMERSERASLEAQLQEARDKIELLTRENGEQYAKGMLEMLERVGQLPPKNNHKMAE